MENVNELSVKELNLLLEKMKKRLAVSNHSEQTIVKTCARLSICASVPANIHVMIDERGGLAYVTDFFHQEIKLKCWRNYTSILKCLNTKSMK